VNGRSRDPKSFVIQVQGLPAWIDSDYYEIVAKAEGAPGQAMMRGPMMQSLLEDRFKLRVHRETKEVPVYVLSVAKGGPRLNATKGGSCTPEDIDNPPPLPEPGKPLPLMCGGQMVRSFGLEMSGATMQDLCVQLFIRTDRIVIDKTGISGNFDINLELSKEDVTPAQLMALMGATPDTSTDPPHSSVFDAVKKLGLKLESGKGPGEFLVIDHIERPSEN
jgi:uncharacterized protein (TIGR03435 family)